MARREQNVKPTSNCGVPGDGVWFTSRDLLVQTGHLDCVSAGLKIKVGLGKSSDSRCRKGRKTSSKREFHRVDGL